MDAHRKVKPERVPFQVRGVLGTIVVALIFLVPITILLLYFEVATVYLWSVSLVALAFFIFQFFTS